MEGRSHSGAGILHEFRRAAKGPRTYITALVTGLGSPRVSRGERLRAVEYFVV